MQMFGSNVTVIPSTTYVWSGFGTRQSGEGRVKSGAVVSTTRA
jgi:hypothetical protein